MKEVIEAIKGYYEIKKPVWLQIAEWRAHNLLYTLGIYRNHTMHTDFNFEIKWYEKIVYFILSLLYFRW